MMRALGNGYGALGFGNPWALGISLGPAPDENDNREQTNLHWP